MTRSTTVDPGTVARPEDRRRAERHRARGWLWDNSKVRRLRACGRSVRSSAGVTIRASGAGADRSAGFGGLVTCGSVWACPECSAKIARERQADIRDALSRWHDRGGRVAMVTLTMRHHAHHRLSTCWDALAKSWGRVTSGRAWVSEQAEHGTLMERTIKSGHRAGQTVVESRVPIIRVVEVTHGPSGWHVHVHALLLIAADDDDVETGSADRLDARVKMLGAQMFQRWSAGLVAAGMPAPSARHGVDAKLLRGDPSAALGDYFVKATYGAAVETARGDLKRARGANVTPWALLVVLTDGSVPEGADLDSLDDPAAVWAEWEQASRGRRQIAWSPGLREFLGMSEEERTDEEVAADDSTAGDVVVEVPGPVWRTVAASAGSYRRWAPQLLDAACLDDGGVAVRAVLDSIPPTVSRRSPWVPRPRSGAPVDNRG